MAERRYVSGLTTLLVAAGVADGLWAISCALMVLIGNRLPDGLLRQVAEFLPTCVATAKTLRKHPLWIWHEL